jgi:hypothetical protein
VSLVHNLLWRRGSGGLAFLVADGFTGAALTAGHAGGVSLATPKELFRVRAGKALQTLSQTLNNAAAFAARMTALELGLDRPLLACAGNSRVSPRLIQAGGPAVCGRKFMKSPLAGKVT